MATTTFKGQTVNTVGALPQVGQKINLTRIAITKPEQHKSCRSSSLKQTSPPGQNSQSRKQLFHALSR